MVANDAPDEEDHNKIHNRILVNDFLNHSLLLPGRQLQEHLGDEPFQ